MLNKLLAYFFFASVCKVSRQLAPQGFSFFFVCSVVALQEEFERNQSVKIPNSLGRSMRQTSGFLPAEQLLPLQGGPRCFVFLSRLSEFLPFSSATLV